MKRYDLARWLIVFALFAGLFATLPSPSAAQSGRKRPVPTPQSQGQPPQTQNPSSSSTGGAGGTAKGSDRSTDKPLSDNTPTTVGDDGTIKLDTFLVTLPVSVMDSGGRFVPDLTKRNFHIFEDGVEQEIETFESVETPFHVALVLDTSNSTRFKLEDIQEAAVAFVNQLRSDDEVMVMSFDSEVHIQSEFTSDRQRLRQAIFRTRTGGSTKLYEAVDQVLDRYMSRIQGRKAVVLFTDGVDTSSRRATYESTLNLAEESDTLFFPIRYDTEEATRGGIYSPRGGGRGGPVIRTPFPFPMPGGRRWPLADWMTTQWPQGGRWPTPGGGRGGGGQGDYRRAAAYLQELADRTGGHLYQADTLSHVSSAFTQIAEELRQQYRLSYYPSNSKKDGSYRRVKVRVDRPGLVVRARDGYKAQVDTQASSGSQDSEKPKLKKKSNLAVN